MPFRHGASDADTVQQSLADHASPLYTVNECLGIYVTISKYFVFNLCWLLVFRFSVL